MRIWVNGALLDENAATLSVLDHGFTVGDGVFETVKVVDGVPFALQRHLARLTRSAAGLRLPPPDEDLIAKACADVLLDAGPGSRRLRITYTAGPSPLGSDRGDATPSLVVAAPPMQPWPPSAAVVTVPWARNERGALAGLKTTSYAENVVALAYAKARGASEAIFANTTGQLCEGTGTNVFVVVDGRLITPTLASGCLAGITRALVLEWCGGEEADLPISVLTEADEIFLTSATREIQPVHAVDGRQLPTVPGPMTARCAEIYARRSAEESEP
jgi:branched-chain amino acid aminotransferase